MNYCLKIVAAVAAFQLVATGAIADSRFAAKNGTATGASCGANSNVSDATSGPCTTITTAYANAKTGGGSVARVIISSSGVFQEPTITLDFASGPSEIRVSGGQQPGVSTSGTGNTFDVDTPNDVRFFDFRISAGATAGTHGINVIQVNTLELHRTEMRGFQGNAVYFAPSTCPNPNVAFLIADSDISGSQTGLIRIFPGGACTVGTAIKNSQIHHSTGYGVRTDSSGTTSSNPVKTLISTSILANFSTAAVVSLVARGIGYLGTNHRRQQFRCERHERYPRKWSECSGGSQWRNRRGKFEWPAISKRRSNRVFR